MAKWVHGYLAVDFGSSRVYELELWSNDGKRLADISNIAKNRVFTLTRNEAEQITFDLDLYVFEALADSIGIDAEDLLNPYAVDVKVKRNGVYWFATQIVAAPLNIGTDYTMNEGQSSPGSSTINPTISVTCTGYLNLFTDRYLDYTYSQQDACFIGGDMLTQAQAQTNGSVGVTIATDNYLTGVLRDRTYQRQNIKSELQNLTQLVDGRFDFAFDANKVFHTYRYIGNKRTDLKFTFGGPQSNIIGIYLDNNAAGTLYNQIIGLGSGLGSDGLISVQNDNDSQLIHYLRQDIKQYSNVSIQSTLDQNATADLALEKDLIRLPQITISGKELEGKPFLSVGDRIPLAMVGHSFLNSLNGIYRIEQMVVSPDDNDFDASIYLYLDDYGVDPNV